MKWGLVALSALASVVFQSAAKASELYGMGYTTRTLYRLSQTNGTATAIGGNYPAMTMRDLASDTRPESFRMWATGFGKQLFRINPITGAATLVGTYGLTGSEEIRTLAYDMVSGKLFGTSDPSNVLYEIDPSSGALTLVGTVGIASLGGMGADLLGNLYAVKEDTGGIYLIDKVTGTPTLLSTTSVTYISDLAVRPEDGTWFAITHQGPVDTYRSLYTLDIVTGNATRLGYTTMNETLMAGLAFGAFVPEPGTGMLVLGGMILLARRRR